MERGSKMKKTAQFLAGILSVAACLPLAAQITFERTYGGQTDDLGIGVMQTPDGGYIISGVSKASGFGGWDFLVMKTNEQGDTLWTWRSGGKFDDAIEGLLIASDGGYLLYGDVNDASSSAIGTMKSALIKLDSHGILEWQKSEWQKSLGWEKCDDALLAAAHAPDGGYYMAGVSNVQYGDWDCLLVHFDTDGNVLWDKLMGISTADYFYGIVATQDGGCAAIGSLGIYTYLVKTDSLGNLQWQRTYETKSYSLGTSIIELPDSGYVFSCNTWTSSTDKKSYDAYLLRTKSDGRLVWRKKFGGDDLDVFSRVRPTGDGGFVAVGSTRSYGAGGQDIYLLKVDSQGRLIWEKTFGGEFDDGGYNFDVTSDGGFIITGSKGVNSKGTNRQIYLIKTDDHGNVIYNLTRDPNAGFPAEFSLYQNYPNPFNLSTTIEFECPSPGQVTVEIHDVYGQKLRTLSEGIQPAGRHRVAWDGRDDRNRMVPTGVYLCRMLAGNGQKTIKLALMK
jgi:hypothetical protein